MCRDIIEKLDGNSAHGYAADSTGRRNIFNRGGVSGATEGWAYELTGRGAMRPLGVPSHRRMVVRRFWEKIATGITSEKAAAAVSETFPIHKSIFQEVRDRTNLIDPCH